MPDKNKISSSWSDDDLPVIDNELTGKIADVESNGGDYNVVNPNTGALGKYQFVPSYHWKAIQKVTGVKTEDEFLKSPEKQEKFFEWHSRNNLEPSIEKLRRFNKDGYDEQQLKMLVHFKGEGGAKKWLKNHIDDTSDNNVSIDKYIGKPSKDASQSNSSSWSDDDLPVIDTDLQKKSPDVSADGVANNSQLGQNGVSQNSEPPQANGAVAGGFNPHSAADWQNPPHNNTPLPPDVAATLTPTDPLTGLPVIGNSQLQSAEAPQVASSSKDTFPISTGGSNTESLSPEIANTLTPVDPTTNLPLLLGQKPALERPEDAANILASHIIDNSHPSYLENLSTTPFNEKGSVVHDTTDPHGDPKRTGDYTQYATTQLEHQRQTELNKLAASRPTDLPSSDASLDPGYQNAENEINKKYDNQIAQVHKAGETLTGAQIAYQEFTQNKNKGEDSPARVNALNQQEEDELSKAEPQQKAAIKLKYAGLKRAIKPSEQYDAVRMGLQQQAMLGDKVAQDDLNKYINGIAIDKNRRVDYQYAGLKMRQNAAQLAKENGQEDIAKEVAPKSDDIYSTLEKDNPEYFGKLYGNKIGSYAFNNEKNPLYGTIFTRPELTPDEIKEYGKKAGLTPQQIAMVKPEYVPTASSVYGQAAQAALNALPGISPTGRFSKVFTGEMPVEQHQMDNWKGFLGEMAGGVGTVASFMAQGGLVGEALKGAEVLGKVATAGKRYETASNLLPLAINNYNSAYENSKTVIGDSPKDEVNRQTYAIVNTILGTAIMSIDPATALGKDALGMSKAGKDFIKTLKTEGIENLTKPEFQSKIAKVIQGAIGTGEHTVKQATIMASTKAAENITDMLYDPDHRHGIMDNTGEAFMRGGVGMFLPSLFAAKHAVNNQSEINKKMAFDVGLNSQQYRSEVTDLYKQGKLTQDEFHTALDGINSLSRIIKVQLPYVKSIDGRDLTMQQKQDYSWSLLKTEDLNKRLATLENSSDKAQENQVNTLLKSEEKTRTDILNKAGEVQSINKPFQPKTEPGGTSSKLFHQEPLKLEKSTEELEPTGAIATEAAKVPEGETPKINEEKLVNTENTSIPLESEIKTQTEQDEKSNGIEQTSLQQTPNIGQEVNTLSEGKDDGKGQEQSGQSRQLSEQSGKENEAGVETPAKPVSDRKRRKLIIEEEPILSEQKPEQNASPQTEKQQQESAQQGSVPEHARTEQAGSEAQATETKNSNSAERSPKKKKVKPPTEFQTRKKAALSGEPSSFREAVLHLIVGGERVNPKDLTQDLGISGNDMKPYLRRISAKGTSVDNFVERYVKDETNPHKIGFVDSHPDATQEARREFMDVWQQYGHDDHAALEELERIQGKGHQKWEEEKYSAHTEGEKLSTATEDEINNFLDHGDFESHQKATDAIRDAELTDKDSDHIISYLSSHINDEGKVDHHTALDISSGEFKEMYENLSPAGKELFDSLLAEKESGGFVELNEKQKADFKKLQDEAAVKKTTRSNSETPEGSASESAPAGSDQRENNEPVSTEEKLIPSPEVERSVATGAQSDKQTPATKEKSGTTFTTSKGSEYQVNKDGSTTRNKSVHNEPGHEGTEGLQQPSDKTYYVTKEDADKLSEVGVSGLPEGESRVIADIGDGKIAVGITSDNEERHGKYIGRTAVEYSTEPKVGLHPVEVIPGKTPHFGNEIVSVKNETQPKPLSIEERIQAERTVHQKLIDQGKAAETKRQKALKSKDPAAIQEATDKVNDIKDKVLAKEAKIDKLINNQTNESAFHKAADWVETKYAKNKKEHEGASYATILGISPKIADHVSDFLVARIVEGLRGVGNLEIAIRRGLRQTKEKYGEEAKELSDKDIEKLKESGMFKAETLKAEPSLSIDNEEYAKDILADIFSGKISHEDAVKEIMDEVIENKDGNPVSDTVSENAKAKVLNYLDWHIQQDITSIKNATTRLRREQFGLGEEIPAAHKEFGETWDEAKKKIEDNPQTALNLIEELSQKARPLTDVENAVLLHHQNTKEIELQNFNDNINKAADEGNQGAIIENKVSKARVLDELQQIYDINKAVGTENARGLASRRMMVDRKYSLVNMISEKRATANEGKSLSDTQQEDIEKLHKNIKDTQEAFDNYIKESESKIIDLQRKAMTGLLKNKKTASTKLREWAERIRQASKNQAYSSPIPITPHMVADAIDVIAYGVEKGEQLVDLIKKAIAQTSNANPGIDEQDLEKEINKAVMDSGILDISPERKKATDASALFSNGRLDREAVRLKVDADRAKAQYDINLKRDQEKQLSKVAKYQNWFIKWQRAFKLSNPLTMGKLMMAGMTRLTTTPLEDIVGGAYSAILPQLAKGAIGEGGGLNINETAKAYKNGLMLGLKDASEIMSKKSQGKSQLDVLFGKAGELPPEAIDFFGQLHSAAKAPIKRTIFERSIERRFRRNIANGVDVTDPMVQTSILMDSYKDANRAIFMQDNKVAEGWRKLINHFDQVDPKTGKAPSKLISSSLQWLVPFVKVPTNIAAEIGTHVYGVPVGAAKLIHAAFTGGIENLPPDEKEIILRNLKKGSLGIAALALGYFNPQNFGGFYQPGQKRDEDDAEALGLKLFGAKIPAWFIEAPIFQAMQIGATVRRVKDKVVKGEPQGISEGLWAGASGLVNDIPLASQPVRVSKLFGSKHERDYYLGELAKSTVDPALITYLAKVTDPADEGNPIRKMIAPENKRATPKTIGEHIKSGVPFLREQLNVKNSHQSTTGAGAGGDWLPDVNK